MPSVATQALVAERRADVLKMRVASVPVSTIAAKYGISEATVHSDVTRALEARTKQLDEATAEYRSMDLEKLEAMERAAWAVLHRKHVHVSASGKIARHPDTQEIIVDDGPTLQAVSALLRIQERRAKLLGLDAVVSSKLEVKQVVDTNVHVRIAAVLGELAAGGLEQSVVGAGVLPLAIDGPSGSVAAGG